MVGEAHFDTFLAELQAEAEVQAKLSSSRILPEKLDAMTSLIGRYPWQTLLITSGVTAVIIQIFSLYAA